MKCFNDFLVDTSIIKNNANNIKKRIGKECKFCAVVKANAYGVGLECVCSALNGIADYFAVANLKEALSIRVFDKSTPILILGLIDKSQVELIANNNIEISVGSYEQLEELSKRNMPMRIHLQINTGLNRFGIRTITEYKKCLKLLKLNTYITVCGVYSHFATKSNDVNFIYRQYIRFKQFKKIYINDSVIYHISNSFATEYSNRFHNDMVRTGFLLYGYGNNTLGNKPVMNIYSKIINILSVRKGDSVGYDRTFVADKNMKVAVVPIGYADGFSRRLSNNFYLLVRDKKCRILGRVCMDVVMIDVNDVDGVKIGEKVTILGKSNKLHITLQEYAEAIGTSEYEVLCNFNYKRANYIVK